MNIRSLICSAIASLTFASLCAAQAHCPGEVVAWGIDDPSHPWDVGQVSDAPEGADFIKISAREFNNLALRTDGTIVVWGDDTHGQVSSAPTGGGFVDIAAGYHCLAVHEDGTIHAWGQNTHGQVSSTPSGNDFVAVTAGHQFSVALREDGSIVAWGRDDHGQVSGAPTSGVFTQIAAGGFHTLALREDRRIIAWGWNFDGQVGGTPQDDIFAGIGAGAYHSVAFDTLGNLYGWGFNQTGQASPPAGSGHIYITGGGGHSAAIHSDSTVVAWGMTHNAGGQDFGQVSDTPEGEGFFAVEAGAFHTIALRLPTAQAPVAGDLNCDGSVGVADLLILLGAWGPCDECPPGPAPAPGGCPADLSGDCAVGVADLLILLANWG